MIMLERKDPALGDITWTPPKDLLVFGAGMSDETKDIEDRIMAGLTAHLYILVTMARLELTMMQFKRAGDLGNAAFRPLSNIIDSFWSAVPGFGRKSN